MPIIISRGPSSGQNIKVGIVRILKAVSSACALAEQNGVKNSQILWPVRTALSGKEVSPGGATEIAEILGDGETMRRLAVGIKKLETEGTVENGSQQ